MVENKPPSRMAKCPECGLVIPNSQDATPEVILRCSCGTVFVILERGNRKINYPNPPAKQRRFTLSSHSYGRN
jgi:hypothetical protein